jgi:dihydropteroate synthase
MDDDRAQRGSAERSEEGRAPSTRRCAVWGVLNVTPDSFSDGGCYLAVEDALRRAEAMVAEGADVIDVGGESSRPPGRTYGAGAVKVAVEEELSRVVPVIERLAPRVTVSIDTVKGAVARAALAAGARVVNDVSGGADDALLEAAAEAEAELVLMHTRDGGKVDATTCRYEDVVVDVRRELQAAVDRARRFGVAPERVWLDPGIGFAKTAAQSARLLGGLEALVETGHPVLVGASRKSWIARILEGAGGPAPGPTERLGGSLAAVTLAVRAGARAVRVHDVRASVQAARVTEAILSGGVAG